MTAMEGTTADAYADASRFLVALTRRVPDAAWNAPGLGSWTVLELVGHANRAHTTVEDYLLHPQAPEPRGSGYFSAEAIAQRGREAVVALGTDPVAAIASASERVLSLVRSTLADATVGSPMETTTLASYLPSRTAELTIHGLDLARALQVEEAAPGSALRATLAFVAERCASREPEQVILALTGRGELQAGYSVY
jgi:uncharacterized protein (TIGR03083 family)